MDKQDRRRRIEATPWQAELRQLGVGGSVQVADGWRMRVTERNVLLSSVKYAHFWHISLPQALLVEYALARDIRMDVGRCPACVARSWPGMRKLATHEWIQFQRAEQSSQEYACRPCQACNGTGRERIEAAILVIEGSSAVDVLSDTLQQHGEHAEFGERIALWRIGVESWVPLALDGGIWAVLREAAR